jgi:hypothetical protein
MLTHTIQGVSLRCAGSVKTMVGRCWWRVLFVYRYCQLERNAKLDFRHFLSFQFIPPYRLNCERVDFGDVNKRNYVYPILFYYVVCYCM